MLFKKPFLSRRKFQNILNGYLESELIFGFLYTEKGSLLSRLFRRSGRNKVRQLETYSGQFPPAEWFNSKAVHLHSVGTQTQDPVSNY